MPIFWLLRRLSRGKGFYFKSLSNGCNVGYTKKYVSSYYLTPVEEFGENPAPGGNPPLPVQRGCQLNRSETTTTGICPAISGATQHSPCFECSRLVDLSLLNLAHSSQRRVAHGVTVETWAKLGKMNTETTSELDPFNFHPCISTPLRAWRSKISFLDD